MLTVIALVPAVEYLIALYLTYYVRKYRADFSVWRGLWRCFMVMLAALFFARISTLFVPEEYGYWTRLVASNIIGIEALRMVWMARKIFHNGDRTPVPVAQIEMDWLGRIYSWNQAATDLLGWTADEAKDKELAGLIIPEDLTVPINGESQLARDIHRAALKTYRETGNAPILNKKFPTKALRKDGKQIDVDVYVTAHVTQYGTRFLGSIMPPLVRL
jgi:PAS domain S-box-containing protein